MTSCIVFPNCGCPSSPDYPDYFHLVLNNLPLTCEVCVFFIFFASLLLCMNARPTLSALDLFAFFYFWTILCWDANVPETCKFGHCMHLTSAAQRLLSVYVPDTLDTSKSYALDHYYAVFSHFWHLPGNVFVLAMMKYWALGGNSTQ